MKTTRYIYTNCGMEYNEVQLKCDKCDSVKHIWNIEFLRNISGEEWWNILFKKNENLN